MRRAVKIYQLAPREMQTRFALVPYGMYLNKALQKAENGSVIEFRTDWRGDRFILLRKAAVKVNSSVFTLLLKSIYGEDATWRRLAEQWRARCVIEGLGKDAFDPESVLLVELKPFVKEEYEAEQERIRLVEEREERIKAIKELRFKHPMVTDL